MEITTISLQNNIPIRNGGTSCSFYINNIIGQKHKLNFLYFLKDNNQIGEIPMQINFSSQYIHNSHTISLLPKLLQRMNFEFLFWNSELKKIKTEIILLESPYLFHIAKIISKHNNNCPIYLLEHNIESEYYRREGFKFWKIIEFYEKWVLKRVNKVFTISKHDYLYFKNLNFLKNISYLKLGVSKEIFSPDGDKYDFNTNKLNILFYGSLDLGFNKNALNFIRNKLRPKLDNNFCIHICGKTSNEIYEKDNIVYHGFVDKIQNYIRGCDVVVVPISGTVGVNMRILEALFCGKIVLVSEDSYKGLDDDLKKIVFKCSSLDDYIKILKKLRKTPNYRYHYEKNIQKAIKDYINNSENILNHIL